MSLGDNLPDSALPTGKLSPRLFDPRTGCIHYLSMKLHRGETLGEFLATYVGAMAQLWMHNQAWREYRVKLDRDTITVVGFKDGVIDNVNIAFGCDSITGDWSEETEMKRKALHDEMLQSELGPPPYRFEWGEIGSYFDPRGLSSSIAVSYA